MLIDEVVSHELAHWAVNKLFEDAQIHGEEWQGMMKALGAEYNRTLQLH